MLLNCDRECRAGRAVAAPPRRRRPRGRGWAGLFTCPMPDQMRMSMPDGNRCSGWAVTAVDALARDVPLSARGRGCRAVPARVAASPAVTPCLCRTPKKTESRDGTNPGVGAMAARESRGDRLFSLESR